MELDESFRPFAIRFHYQVAELERVCEFFDSLGSVPEERTLDRLLMRYSTVGRALMEKILMVFAPLDCPLDLVTFVTLYSYMVMSSPKEHMSNIFYALDRANEGFLSFNTLDWLFEQINGPIDSSVTSLQFRVFTESLRSRTQTISASLFDGLYSMHPYFFQPYFSFVTKLIIRGLGLEAFDDLLYRHSHAEELIEYQILHGRPLQLSPCSRLCRLLSHRNVRPFDFMIPPEEVRLGTLAFMTLPELTMRFVREENVHRLLSTSGSILSRLESCNMATSRSRRYSSKHPRRTSRSTPTGSMVPSSTSPLLLSATPVIPLHPQHDSFSQRDAMLSLSTIPTLTLPLTQDIGALNRRLSEMRGQRSTTH